MTTAILFIIAAWGWYCLVEFSDGAEWESSGDPLHPASKAIKAIQEVLG